jgi:hypothetical protein
LKRVPPLGIVRIHVGIAVELGDIDAIPLTNHNFASAAIDRRPRTNAYKPVLARGIVVLAHSQTANYAPAVEPLMMVPEFVDVVPLFVAKIALDQQFAGEVVVPRKRT